MFSKEHVVSSKEMLSFPNPKQLLVDTLIHSFKKTRSRQKGKLKIYMSLFDIVLNELFLP